MNLPTFHPENQASGEAIANAACEFLHALAEAQRPLMARHFDVCALLEHQCTQIDTIISALFDRALADYPVSVVALGGYGRKELFPGSDIDLLILVDETSNDARDQAISTFIHLLWQLGHDIAQHVCTAQQCLDDARDDLDHLTALLEARLIAGDAAELNTVMTHLREQCSAADFIQAKLDERRYRDSKQEQMGRLEPNIKIAPGGLRDIHMIGWINAFCYRSHSHANLIDQGILTQEEYAELIKCRERLWRIRYALHLFSKGQKDRLSFEQQKLIAKLFAYQDLPGNQAIEQFMRFYYRNSRRIRRINRLVVKIIEIAHEKADPGTIIDNWFCYKHRRLTLRRPDDLQKHPELLWRIFQRLQEHPNINGLHPDLARQIHRERDLIITQEFRHDNDIRRAFLAIFNHSGDVHKQLRRMLRFGILYRYIPTFWHTVGRMQYDLFHQFTVDQHTLHLIRVLDSFKEPQEDYPQAHELLTNFREPATLYLAALFHDIGKGYHGDHSDIGAEMAANFAAENDALNLEERDLLVFLVREHLSLSLTAQKKDLTDPEVISEFARKFPDRRYLDALYLLTMADITATSPTLWNSWRANLLFTLYRLSVNALKNTPPDIAAQITHAQNETLAVLDADPTDIRRCWDNLPEAFFLNEEPVVIAAKTVHLLEHGVQPAVSQTLSSPPRLFISAPSASDILFARATHCMERHDLDIVEARLYRSEDGTLAIQQYTLNEQFPLTESHVSALQHFIINQEAPKPLGKRLSRTPLQHFNTHTKIDIEQDAQHDRTILHLTCKDRHGLLSLISRVFLEQGIHLAHAKIATLGEKVEDTFYLTDANHQAITDTTTLQQLRDRLHELLD
ncbi:[protein-PII] uridylyltransferase [Suttonella sp. R2A3]|uniref:[protein-PII] uridylyltransferase n=1 Tax=Suttonella sp. R2A3 TaxID=2908648 RepID=UPI001F1FED55|nr:[protein-PII] uridylyltransferase [Suttonella sp. R2A3]UJF24631.1 [protein-PII] uridylyltransferase [Suttonella sp. R2A3]